MNTGDVPTTVIATTLKEGTRVKLKSTQMSPLMHNFFVHPDDRPIPPLQICNDKTVESHVQDAQYRIDVQHSGDTWFVNKLSGAPHSFNRFR